MNHVNVMLKPVSSNCNMCCKYCFYRDTAIHREIPSYGTMKTDVLETIVRRVFESAENSCSFVFQGGEPTLIGVEFFRTFLELLIKYNVKKIQVNNALQTNGLLINEEWVEILKQGDFLVGLSVDGTRETHDYLRVDNEKNGTFQQVRSTALLLDNADVKYNILTTVTKQTARHIVKIYRLYTRTFGWKYIQFTPCLDPYGAPRGGETYSLSPKDYGNFLINLFDVWYQDLCRGNYVYIRYFENLAGILMGIPPESCSLMGGCSAQLVVEADGSVYPCDFYVTAGRTMGDFNTSTVEELLTSNHALKFRAESFPPAQSCQECPWAVLCRGGCRRDRDNQGEIGLNYYCASYRLFFEYIQSRLNHLKEIYVQM